MTRQFCANCASPLFTLFEVEPARICVKIGSLDDPSWARPQLQVYVKSKLPWLRIDDGLPQLEGEIE